MAMRTSGEIDDKPSESPPQLFFPGESEKQRVRLHVQASQRCCAMRAVL